MVEGSTEKKLVKATDLPIHGNPFPPQDVTQNEGPNMIEAKIGSLRTILQPFVSPIASVLTKTGEIASIGKAHSQSTLQGLIENQNSLLNALVISSSGFIGMALARRGVLRRLAFGGMFVAVSTVAIYPKESEEKVKLLLYVAKNKLPQVAEEQYKKLIGGQKEDTNDLQKVAEPKTAQN